MYSATSRAIYSVQVVIDAATSTPEDPSAQGSSRIESRSESATSSAPPAAISIGSLVDSPTTVNRARRLEGKTYSSGHIVKDLDGKLGCFFVFPDLTIRDAGSFALRFRLIRIRGPESAGPSMSGPGARPGTSSGAVPLLLSDRPSGSLSTSSSSSSSSAGGRPSTSPSFTTPTTSLAGGVETEVLSEVFPNYAPRRFPGSLESTPLTRALAAQGVLAPIRNYSTTNRARGRAEADGPTGSDEADEGDAGPSMEG